MNSLESNIFHVKSFPYRFCDIGLNLMDHMYKGIYRGKVRHENDLFQVLKRGKQYGVHKSILTGTAFDESKESLDFCREYSISSEKQMNLYTTVGIHPSHSSVFKNNKKSADEIINNLETLIMDGINGDFVVALGECGLDYDRLHFSSKEAQLIGFHKQLELSARLAHPLPLFLHNRNTQGEFYEILRTHHYPDNLRKSGVVHTFDGSLDDLHQALELGLYIGINGCSLKTKENLEVVKHIPDNRLLLETDAPWCGVKPTHAGHSFIKTTFPTKKLEKYDATAASEGYLVKDRNEPCTMIQILEIVAHIRQQDPQVLADTVYENTERLFFS